MDVFYSYTYGTAAWLALQAVPLIVSPTVIVTLLSPAVREATTLEVYFSRSLGFTLLALGVLNLLLTGSIPLTSRLTDASGAVTTDPEDPKAPYAMPSLSVTLAYHAAVAFYCYAMWTQTGVTSFAFGTVFSGVLSAIGLWCVLFASSDGRISRKTGADKRTSGFPFKNSEAHSDKKKAMKKGL